MKGGILRLSVLLTFVAFTHAALADCQLLSAKLQDGQPAHATDVVNYITGCASFSGNVGIGTTAPQYPLHVIGNIKSARMISGDATGITIGSNGSELPMLQFNQSDNSKRFWFQTNGINTAQERLSLYGGPLNSNATTEMMVFGGNGNVGIGTTTPAVTLAVAGDIRAGTSGGNGCLENYAGTAIAGTCSSDAALKTVMGSVTDVLGKFSKLELVTFHWNDLAARLYHNSRTTANVGYIAQAVERQFPELVSIDKKGYRQVDYTRLEFYGLEAIRELKTENDEQSAEISTLKKRLADADKRAAEVGDLEKRLSAINQKVAVIEARLATRVGSVDRDGRQLASASDGTPQRDGRLGHSAAQFKDALLK